MYSPLTWQPGQAFDDSPFGRPISYTAQRKRGRHILKDVTGVPLTNSSGIISCRHQFILTQLGLLSAFTSRWFDMPYPLPDDINTSASEPAPSGGGET